MYFFVINNTRRTGLKDDKNDSSTMHMLSQNITPNNSTNKTDQTVLDFLKSQLDSRYQAKHGSWVNTSHQVFYIILCIKFEFRIWTKIVRLLARLPIEGINQYLRGTIPRKWTFMGHLNVSKFVYNLEWFIVGYKKKIRPKV